MLAYIHIMFHSKLFSFTFKIVHVSRIKWKLKFSHISTRFSKLGMYSNDISVSVSVYEILWCDSSKRVLFRGTLLFLTTFLQNELQSSCFFYFNICQCLNQRVKPFTRIPWRAVAYQYGWNLFNPTKITTTKLIRHGGSCTCYHR